MAVKPISEGYRTVTPYLLVQGAADLIEFMAAAFGAREQFRMTGVNGGVGHAEVEVGDSVIMLADSSETDRDLVMPATIHLYVPDCDAAYRAALAAGATSEREPATQFYGDRNAVVRDRWGNRWFVSTHVEDVPPEEMARGSEEWLERERAGER
jgi:PhnB protein